MTYIEYFADSAESVEPEEHLEGKNKEELNNNYGIRKSVKELKTEVVSAMEKIPGAECLINILDEIEESFTIPGLLEVAKKGCNNWKVFYGKSLAENEENIKEIESRPVNDWNMHLLEVEYKWVERNQLGLLLIGKINNLIIDIELVRGE